MSNNVQCDCSGWRSSFEKLIAPGLLAYARNPQTHKGYAGEVFKYCPWCGKGLIENAKKEKWEECDNPDCEDGLVYKGSKICGTYVKCPDCKGTGKKTTKPKE